MRRFVALVLSLGCVSLGCRSEAKTASEVTGGSPEARVRRLLYAAPSEPVEWLGPRPKDPARVVSVAPGLTETLFALGRGDRVVGVSRFVDFPEAAKERPQVGGYTDLDVEAVLALEPHLVVAVPGGAYRARLEQLALAGTSVVILPNSSVADVRVWLETLGRVLGARDRATALERQMLEGLLTLAERPTGSVRAVLVYGWNPVFVAGAGSFPDALLGVVGATNAAPKGDSWPTLSEEALLGLSPRLIIDAAGGQPPPGIRAFEDQGRLSIARAPSSSLLRPGPRMVEAAQALAALVAERGVD